MNPAPGGAHAHQAVISATTAQRREEIAGLAKPLHADKFERSVHISLKYGYAYFETPKVACSTVKLTLFRAELEDTNFSYAENRQIHIASLGPLLSPMKVPGVAKRLDRLFKFCFVRDPGVRVVSAYLDKIQRNKPQKAAVVRALGRSEADANVSFDEFVGVVCDQDPLAMDPHWGVQYYQVFRSKIAHDFVGRFETFDRDFSKVLEHAGIEPAYRQNAKSHATKAETQSSEFLTPALRVKIEDKFKLDYEAFGY